MVSKIHTLLLAAAPLFAAPAFAHTVEQVCARAGSLATDSEQVATLAASTDPRLAAASRSLQSTTQGFQAATLASEGPEGGAGHQDGDAVSAASFGDVERSFWAVANAWNSDSFELSQNAPVLEAYDRLVADYRQLLFTVYDLPLDAGAPVPGDGDGHVGEQR